MLKYFLPFILFAHGLIHMMGFAKAFNYANITQLTKDISKTNGIFWLLTALLFVTAAILCFLKKEGWVYVAFAAVVISQVLIISVWHDAKFGTVLNIIILVFTISSWATFHFEMNFKKDVDNHMAETNFVTNDLLMDADIDSLPFPIQKYIRYSGAVNKPKIKI